MTKQESSKPFVIVLVITVIVIVGFIAVLGILSKNSGNPDVVGASTNTTSNTVSTTGDKQIVEVTAKGGYSPNVITAKAGVPTTLKMISNGAYGCERAFRISSLGIAQNLPVNGEIEFDLGTQTAGSKIRAACSMGMYSFTINFN